MTGGPGGKADNAGGPIALSGKGAVELLVKDLSVALADLKPEAIIAGGKGIATITVTDLTVTPDMGGSKQPVRVDSLAAAVLLAPGQAPKVTINSGLNHEGSAFAIDGDVALEGLKNGMPKAKGPGALAELNPTGTIAVKNLPRSALWIVGALNNKFGDNGKGATASESARAIATAGARVDRREPDDDGETVAGGRGQGRRAVGEHEARHGEQGRLGGCVARVTDKEAELTRRGADRRVEPGDAKSSVGSA